MLSAHEAASVRFDRVRRGGYDPRQVDEFHDKAAEALVALEHAVRELKAREIRTASDEVVEDTMAAALEAKERIIRTAEERAEAELAEAAERAEAMIAEASAQVDELRREIETMRHEAETVRVETRHRVTQAVAPIGWEGTGSGAAIDLVSEISSNDPEAASPERNLAHAYVVADTSHLDQGNGGRRRRDDITIDLRDPWRR